MRVTPLTETGPGAPQDVDVPAGRTAAVPLGADGALIQPLPGSGPVHAARVLVQKASGDQFLTVLPIGPAPRTIPLPPVSGSLTAIID